MKKSEPDDRKSDNHKGEPDDDGDDDDDDDDDDDEHFDAYVCDKNEGDSSKSAIDRKDGEAKKCAAGPYSYPTDHFALGSIANDERDPDDDDYEYDCDESGDEGGSGTGHGGNRDGGRGGNGSRGSGVESNCGLGVDILAMQGFSFAGSHKDKV